MFRKLFTFGKPRGQTPSCLPLGTGPSATTSRQDSAMANVGALISRIGLLAPLVELYSGTLNNNIGNSFGFYITVG